jgi:multiple sugar transport system permease protein
VAIGRTLDTPRVRSARAGARGGGRTAALLLTPFFVLFGLVTLLPIGYAVWLSLFQEKHSGLGFGPTVKVFSGLGNYTKALGSSVFRGGFVHVAVFAVLYVPVMLGGALALALLLDSSLTRAKRFFQFGFFLPHVVPGIIAALIWLYLYTPHVSPVINVLQHVGISFNLNRTAVAVPSMVNVAVWEVMGYNMVIFYAALQAIPRETLEAATVDGAGELRRAWNIKLPMIRSSAGLVALFTGVGVLQLFNEPLMISSYAPGAISSSWTPNLVNYNEAFTNANFGAAAAGSILLALVSAGLSFVITRFSNPWKAA